MLAQGGCEWVVLHVVRSRLDGQPHFISDIPLPTSVQDSGCKDATGIEATLQIVVDAIWNLCMAYGGWHITTVIATSQDGVNTQTDEAANSLFHSPTCPDGLQPLADLCYRPVTRVFTSQHLKMLSGDTRGVYGASRSALAMACGFSHFLNQIGLPARVEDVYTAVAQHPYFRQRIVEWEAWEGGEPDENAVEAMKDTAASINGEFARCFNGEFVRSLKSCSSVS